MKDYKMCPVYLDPEIIDITRLMVIFGSFSKRFISYEEMEDWKNKAKTLKVTNNKEGLL